MPKHKAVVSMLNLKKIMQHMPGLISKLFDSWASPVFHLILLKSSMNAKDKFKQNQSGKGLTG